MVLMHGATLLRPFERRDIDYVWRMRNDLELESPSQPGYPEPTPRSLYEGRYNSGMSAMSSGDPLDLEWAITRRTDDTRSIVGVAGLYGVKGPHRLAELGVVIADASARRCGIGQDSYVALARFAFAHQEAEKCFGQIKETNVAAMGSMARLGLTKEATLRAHRFENGKRVNLVVFSLLREEWSEDMVKQLDLDRGRERRER